jgi:hypothetical protein
LIAGNSAQTGQAGEETFHAGSHVLRRQRVGAAESDRLSHNRNAITASRITIATRKRSARHLATREDARFSILVRCKCLAISWRRIACRTSRIACNPLIAPLAGPLSLTAVLSHSRPWRSESAIAAAVPCDRAVA